jgi:hypothetical protein
MVVGPMTANFFGLPLGGREKSGMLIQSYAQFRPPRQSSLASYSDHPAHFFLHRHTSYSPRSIRSVQVTRSLGGHYV